MSVYVVSDLHFCHNKDFIYGPRGFNSVEEHDATIIENWNSVITNEDDVYILGDLMLKDNEVGMRYLNMLNGNFYIALGNHDSDARAELYRSYPKVKDIQFAYRLRYKKTMLYLTHYPTDTGNYRHPRVYNVCGHTHQKEKWIGPNNGCYNVALDAHNNYPVLLDDIVIEIKNKIKTDAQ